jgi:hypothetical protein
MFAKKIIILLFFTIIISSFLFAQDANDSSTVTGKKVDDGVVYGNDLSPDVQSILLSDLIANPENYEGKTICVSGSITDVCQGMGCWMKISDGTNEVMVQTLHKFFMPKDAAGGNAVTEGKFKMTEISEEHAKEMTKESLNPKVKPEEIKGTQKMYVIQATGVKILNK